VPWELYGWFRLCPYPSQGYLRYCSKLPLLVKETCSDHSHRFPSCGSGNRSAGKPGKREEGAALTFLCCSENCTASGMLLAVVLLHRAECSGAVWSEASAAVGLCCCCGAVLLLCCSPSQAALQLQSVIQWGLHREDEVGELASMFIVAL